MIYIVTAVHNRYETTKKFVQNLKKQTYTEYRLLLVDDGSTDGTADMVKSELPDAMIIYGNGNLWWGGALHKAYKYLCKSKELFDYVMYANDDTEFEEEFIKKAISRVKNNPSKLISACGYDTQTNRLLDAPVQYNVKTGEIVRLRPGEEGNCGTTRALFMSRSTFMDIKGFHPFLLPHYASDYEYTLRASRKGHAIISFDDLYYHFDPGTTGHNEHLAQTSIKKLFSKRSRFNPIYRLNFMIMVTPLKYIPVNIAFGMKRMITEFINK